MRNYTESCKKVNNIFSSSRVIIFILGGATFSEVRSGYEVSKDKSSAWEIIVGRFYDNNRCEIQFWNSRWRHTNFDTRRVSPKCWQFRISSIIITFPKVVFKLIFTDFYFCTFFSIKEYIYLREAFTSMNTKTKSLKSCDK